MIPASRYLSKVKLSAATLLLVCITVLISSCSLIGGNFSGFPEDISELSGPAKALIEKAYADVNGDQLRDYHTHIAGLDPVTNGTFVNEGWQNPLRLFSYIKFRAYLSASGITDRSQTDIQYLNRLNSLIQYLPHQGKFGIMAFDYFHNSQGKADKLLSTFHVPNDYVLRIVKQFPQHFFPIISIHPYRDDAVTRLEHYAKGGVRFVKWLPNAMGINPSSEDPSLQKKLGRFYEIMRKHGMVLITHTGDEKATEAEEFQHYGNPLYLRKPLSMGVQVIMAHVASLGACKMEEANTCNTGTPYVDIAINMMRDPKYKKLLYADISAITQFNRKHTIDTIIESTDIHENLVNGSDYPLPAVNLVIQTRSLVDSGHITPEERTLLNEIYNINPLLFDYVLKRTVRHSVTGQQFPATIFMKHPRFTDFWRDDETRIE